jgi:nitrite reductase (NADH) large subunit
MVGHRFVEALRARDTDGAWRIVVFGEEPDAAYDRVGLSSYVGAWDRALLALSGNDYAGDDLVELRLGSAVSAIDRDARRLTIADGSELSYDALVLATGSYPFVPPVPGRDAAGCHVYRTLDDLDAIRVDAEAALARDPDAVGVVVGGGLLGLEAANALRLLGMRPHIVEFAPRLMPLQVDQAGGEHLLRSVRELGIGVTVSAGTSVIEPIVDQGANRLRVRLSNDEVIDAALLVFSAGVRPRDELARSAGLVVGERGGVNCDLACATSDPAIYAIGEVAAVDGRCYGLVGPGYAGAEVVADRLLGGDAKFPGADLSTKLKLLGVDVASFGDALATTPGSLEVVVSDPIGATYAKLVLSDDAQTLLGGVLVGGASSYGVLRPLAALCAAITDGACAVTDLKGCTNAGTSCGSCVPLLSQLLAAQGVEVPKALCEHFSHSRSELFEIVQAGGIRTFSGLIERYGSGTGCDICKPAVASILASTSSEHILDGEQASLQDTNDHFLANLQRNGTYSVVPRVPGGDITPAQLILIGEIARDFGLYTKITGGQRIDMFGATVDQLPSIWLRLVEGGMESGHAYGKSLRTVKSCVGTDWCRYGQQDSVQLAIDLELRYRGLRAPHKIKMAVSGCARECAEARGKDVGVIATEAGWNLYVGGNGGMTPKHAQLLASDLDGDTLVQYIDRFLMYYIRTASRLQRTAPWLDELDGGLDHLRAVIIDDSLGLAGDFEAAMERHVDGYRCEWKAVLDDPEKLARFVSFVNAPGAPDPTVEFTDKNGRKVPVLIGTPMVRSR